MSSLPQLPGFQRPDARVLCERPTEPRRLIQFVGGPRHAGKTTIVHQALDGLATPSRYASADDPAIRDTLGSAGARRHHLLEQPTEAGFLAPVEPAGASFWSFMCCCQSMVLTTISRSSSLTLRGFRYAQ
jgi:hypothetical protein